MPSPAAALGAARFFPAAPPATAPGGPVGDGRGLLRLLSGVMLLGNVGIEEDDNKSSSVASEEELATVAELFGVDVTALKLALTFRTMSVAGGGGSPSTKSRWTRRRRTTPGTPWRRRSTAASSTGWSQR